MVDFAGWSMPVQYGSIVEEHQATRRAAGLFDVSHMGRLRFDGAGAAAFLDRLLTRKVVGMGPGKIRYSLVCNESGGILDDVLVYHLQAARRRAVSPAGRQRQQSREDRRLAAVATCSRATTCDSTDQTRRDGDDRRARAGGARDRSSRSSEPIWAGWGTTRALETTICGHAGIVSRTGYTGEDGCELIVPADGGRRSVGARCWRTAQAAGAMAAGLGARDTLRLEAAMPLYGHELSEADQSDPGRAWRSP